MALKDRGGYWWVDLRVDGKRVRKTTGVPTSGIKAEAWTIHDQIEREALHRAQERTEGAAQGPTLQDTFDAALLDREQWRSGDQRTLESTFRALTAHWPGTVPLSAIDDDAVQGWRRQMLADKLAPNTVNARLSMLSVLFRQARMRPPQYDRAQVRQGRIRTLSRAEEAQVLSWFATNGPQEMHDLVACLLDTGFRLSEMLRVTPRDIAWDTGMLACWVNKARHPRAIPMTQRVQDILAARRQWSLSVDRAEHHWQRMRKALGLDHDREFVMHALRHTCASRLAEAGVDAFRIQAWMGHKSVTTTQQYVTIYGTQLGDLARVLERVQERDHRGGNDRDSEPATVEETDRIQVDTGLLIRRSLVRAQVGEPSTIKQLQQNPQENPAQCDQECDQKDVGSTHHSIRGEALPGIPKGVPKGDLK